jgi:hypothetical protein
MKDPLYAGSSRDTYFQYTLEEAVGAASYPDRQINKVAVFVTAE